MPSTWPDDYDMESQFLRYALRKRFGDALPWIPVVALGIVVLMGLAAWMILRLRDPRRAGLR